MNIYWFYLIIEFSWSKVVQNSFWIEIKLSPLESFITGSFLWIKFIFLVTTYRGRRATCKWSLVRCSAEVRDREKEPFIDSMHTYVVCYATNLLITDMDTLRTIRPSTSPTRPFVRYQIVQFLKAPNTQTTRVQTTWCGVWSGRDPFRMPCENYVLIYPHVWEKKNWKSPILGILVPMSECATWNLPRLRLFAQLYFFHQLHWAKTIFHICIPLLSQLTPAIVWRNKK